ncbi:hypothetical protein ACFQX7_21640 [Luedemannella flava]
MEAAVAQASATTAGLRSPSAAPALATSAGVGASGGTGTPAAPAASANRACCNSSR